MTKRNYPKNRKPRTEKRNQFEILADGTTVKIKLTQGKFGFCDLEDWSKLSNYSWCAHKNSQLEDSFYMMTSVKSVDSNKRTTIEMHRMIFDLDGKKFQVNHKDHDGLNCRKSNMEVCSSQENCFYRRKHRDNTSGYKGVYWHKRDSVWVAGICVDYKTIHLGYFQNKIDAAKAYNEAALKYFGSFAILNEVD